MELLRPLPAAVGACKQGGALSSEHAQRGMIQVSILSGAMLMYYQLQVNFLLLL